MRGPARFRIAESRRYSALRGALSLLVGGCGLALLYDNHAGGGFALIASLWLWHLLGRLNPRGFTLEACPSSAPGARAGGPLRWWIGDGWTEDGWTGDGGRGQPAPVQLRRRGLFRSVLWLEVESEGGFPRGLGRVSPLLIFADAMDDGDWRGLRRTLRVYGPSAARRRRR